MLQGDEGFPHGYLRVEPTSGPLLADSQAAWSPGRAQLPTSPGTALRPHCPASPHRLPAVPRPALPNIIPPEPERLLHRALRRPAAAFGGHKQAAARRPSGCHGPISSRALPSPGGRDGCGPARLRSHLLPCAPPLGRLGTRGLLGPLLESPCSQATVTAAAAASWWSCSGQADAGHCTELCSPAPSAPAWVGTTRHPDLTLSGSLWGSWLHSGPARLL